MADQAAGRSELDPEQHQLIYGRWAAWLPAQVNDLLAGSGIRWWIGGGRAARVGAAPREHEDTDVVVRFSDLPELREHLRDWHLWEVDSGWLRPLHPHDQLHDGSEQLWVRLDAEHPWVADVLLDQSTDDAWVQEGPHRPTSVGPGATRRGRHPLPEAGSGPAAQGPPRPGQGPGRPGGRRTHC